MNPEDGPYTMKFTNGWKGGITFFPFAVAVFWDWAMENGVAPGFWDHAESNLDFQARIKDKLNTHWEVVNRSRPRWFHWQFNRVDHMSEDGTCEFMDPAWTVNAWVRQGQNQDVETLFREVREEARPGFQGNHWVGPWEDAGGYRIVVVMPRPEPWSHITETARVRELRPKLPEHWLQDPRVQSWQRDASA